MGNLDLLSSFILYLVFCLIVSFFIIRMLYIYAETREKRINEDSFKILFECIGKDTFKWFKDAAPINSIPRTYCVNEHDV